MAKMRVGVVGATGLAGQQFLAALGDHPWFEVTALAASERSAGKKYVDAITASNGALQWYCGEPLPARFRDMPVVEASRLDVGAVDLVFTGVEAEPARELEPMYAKSVPVISTASAFRYDDDVPILIPPVNAAHADLLAVQRRKRGWVKGFITPIPNCTMTGLAIALKPVVDAFGVTRVFMTSMQACSGAGRSPGVIGLDIVDNLIPYIPKEEEKVEIETKKVLGAYAGDAITPAAFAVSATCTRVAVLEGHTEAVHCELAKKAEPAEVAAAMRAWAETAATCGWPSAPKRWIHLLDDPFRPQPRRDRDAEDGMATSVGRVRRDSAFENGVKFVLVSHNTKMGAAKGAILVAEMLKARGVIG